MTSDEEMKVTDTLVATPRTQNMTDMVEFANAQQSCCLYPGDARVRNVVMGEMKQTDKNRN